MNRSELVAAGDGMAKELRKINENEPGTRAALRRGLGRSPEDIANFHAHAVVTRYLPENADHATERAFYTVAALIAAQPRGARDQEAVMGAQTSEADTGMDADEAGAGIGEGGDPPNGDVDEGSATGGWEPRNASSRYNLGETLGWAVERGLLNGDTVQPRLHLLARYRVDRLHRELPRLVSHLRADKIPIDWGYLLRDLALWGDHRDQVAKDWVQKYHRTRHRIQSEKKRKAAENNGTAAPAKDSDDHDNNSPTSPESELS